MVDAEERRWYTWHKKDSKGGGRHDIRGTNWVSAQGEWYLHATEKIAMASDMATEGEYLTFELRVWDNYDRYYPRVLSQYQIRQGGSVTKTVYELQGDSQ